MGILANGEVSGRGSTDHGSASTVGGSGRGGKRRGDSGGCGGGSKDHGSAASPSGRKRRGDRGGRGRDSTDHGSGASVAFRDVLSRALLLVVRSDTASSGTPSRFGSNSASRSSITVKLLGVPIPEQKPRLPGPASMR